MRWIVQAVAVLALWAVAPAGIAAPLEAYGRLPALDEVTISPDGRHLAYVTSAAQGRRVVVQRLADDKILTTLEAGTNKVRWLDWAGPRHLLVTLSKTSFMEDPTGNATFMGGIGEYFTVQAYSLERNRVHAPMQLAQQALNVVSDRPAVRMMSGRPVVFLEGTSYATADSGKPLATLYRANLDTPSLAKLETGPRTTLGWVPDPQGRPRVQAQYDQKTGRYSLLVADQGRWVERHAETALLDQPTLMGFGRTADELLVLAYRNGLPAYFVLSLTRGGLSPMPSLSPLDELIHDPVSHLLIGRMQVGENRTRYTFFDPADQRAWDGVVKAFAGQEVTLASWTDDRRRVVVKVVGTRDGAAYAFVDLGTGKVDWLGDAHQGVTDKDVAEVQTLAYPAADGLRIPAYLTLPQGREPKALPLVVLAHGGPESRDVPGFDWWAQALASRGYAVLQPQFRGSSGFSHEHLTAGYGQWGRKMQTDLSDGVRHLAAKGIIDSKRVCIVGASYGGYAALAGATLDPGVYRCAVSVAGVSDPRAMIARESREGLESNNIVTRYWARFMGVTDARDSRLDAISPVRLADRADAPVLLIHGQDDTVVPYQQSVAMERALKQAGKRVSLVTLKGEDHWLSGGETRMQMLDASVRFLETSNPPR